jgi:hypothetical protein
MQVSIPVEAGNKAFRDGTLPKTINTFVEKYKPESAVFTAVKGKRTAFFVVNLKDAAEIPSMAEPFFNSYNAEIEFLPAMNLEDMKAGVERAMKQH